MIAFLQSMGYWHWLVFGAVLIAAEVFVPGALMMWPGVAAIVVGIALVAVPGMSWTTAVGLWAVLSVVSVAGWIAWRKKHPATGSETGTLNQRGHEFIGQIFTLEKPVVNGKGEIRAGDTVWRAICDRDVSSGQPVRVTAVEGTSLRIEPA